MYNMGDVSLLKSGQLSNTLRLGDTFEFEDLNYGSFENVKPKYSGMKIYARLVKNGSGGTLAKGAVCYWDVGSNGPGMEVDGVAADASDQMPAGVVNPWQPSAVADGDTFLLIYQGPAKFLSTTGTALVFGDVLTLGAAGRVVKYDPATADARDSLLYCGRVLEAVASGAASDTLFRGFVDCKF